MAVSRHNGTAITTATPVTAKVPTIKGAKPNCPLKGFHSVENRSSESGRENNIGADRIVNPTTINTIKEHASIVKTIMPFLA